MILLIVAAACLVVAALAAAVRRGLLSTAAAEDRHEGWDMHTGELSALRVELTQDLPASALPWPEPVDGERWPEPVTGRTAPAGGVYRSAPVPVVDTGRRRAEPPDDGTGQWAAANPATAGVNPWFAQHVARSTARGGSW
ncbi:hypothetical protein [Solwaraspora sp. WMMD792]|uniref:hypothetical protein n=1 Tax=Solwaraspora sp. WMMD792 TaxID=3016099 RepID=UPI002416A2BA|nr:hypothetical protein [Solwaraspora sp. WMMD792]MDG4768750.1 hypothetical protein [Solwaraspora sp. WMMD792]MDG4768789.1 hypothetical protein [Solwaraspora sp. WMMD792]MDG4768829.1 hypothetical protein [Solwaraspora sp. WMMD792]MDG4768855.1 hypothetical protein [Solwaraspora sp. WMMD792]MDG4768888.1 hypothetical protein [Solwaraspora sp. WMMD792]